jgi:hypothetical protein
MSSMGNSGVEQAVPAALANQLEAAWQHARSIEPARGKAGAEQVRELRTALEAVMAERARLDGAALTGDARTAVDGSTATLHARAAVVAIAAGDEVSAERWLAIAEELSRDDAQRAELAAARRSHERYRALIHGRNLMARDRERAARTLWKALARGGGDAIARAAADELTAPRPIRPRDRMPTLHRINGIGAAFYGARDRWPDRSYVTTHCISLVFLPVIPLGAWRVRDTGGGYQILAREQLSPFARAVRWIVPTAIAVAIAVTAVVMHVQDPERLARQRWDHALEAAHDGEPEAALRLLDDELLGDLDHAGAAQAEAAGAEVVRLSAGYVARPFTADLLDQALRVVHRYHALPLGARAGAAQAAMVAALDRWIDQLGTGTATAEPRLALLAAQYEIASADLRRTLGARITALRRTLAAARTAEWPLDALAILVEPVADVDSTALIAQADPIVASLFDAPSLLLDAGNDLDIWLTATSPALRARATELRASAMTGRDAAQAEGVTPAQLAALQASRPLDQYVVLALARNEASAGNVAAAAARLGALGRPGRMIREARLVLAQLLAAQGKLDDADRLLGSLLGAELPRFAAASAALEAASKRVQERVRQALDSGNIPADLRRSYEATTDESARHDLISHWIDGEMEHDAALSDARAKYVALAHVVPAALAAGSVKLRRAQAMSGPAREAMLNDAERTFLSIRVAAEGEPTYQLGLGEIYARLGKTAESDAAFAAVLAKNDPELSLGVAQVYRGIGSHARAQQIAHQVFDTARSPDKERAAALLGLMSERDEDEAEGWYRKADQTDRSVRASLLEVEGRRFRHRGDDTACAARFAAAAKLHFEIARLGNATGYNNAAVTDQEAFSCNGDPQLLRDAAAALEAAYRRAPDDPIITGNLTGVLMTVGELRVASHHLDARALRLHPSDVSRMIEMLLAGSERARVLAELAADPSVRRASEVLAQYEILAPNSAMAYTVRFTEAERARDAVAGAAVVERARRATGLDVSEARATRERWLAGTYDAKQLAAFENSRRRLEAALARRDLDPRTRAAGSYLLASVLENYAVYRPEPALLGQARDAATLAMQLWPALDTHALIEGTLIDEAGLAADAKAWSAARRLRAAAAALDQLVTERPPLAAAIRGAKQWPEVIAHTKADTREPDLDDLRLARLIGDPALEARARAALDNQLVHQRLALAIVLDPDNPTGKADLAYLERR